MINNIDWTNPLIKIFQYFTVEEALYLPSWKVMHIPSKVEQENILKLAEKLDLVREFIKSPISVRCWIRPVLNNPASQYHGQDYNKFIKGAPGSSHKTGLAVDWHSPGTNCDDMRKFLIGKLAEWDLRMEDLPKSSWIHLAADYKTGNHFFKP